MKIFSKEQIYKGDQITAKKQKISSTDLMERAGTQIFNWIHQRMQGAQVPIHVFWHKELFIPGETLKYCLFYAVFPFLFGFLARSTVLLYAFKRLLNLLN